VYGTAACSPWHGRAVVWCERKRQQCQWRRRPPPGLETMARSVTSRPNKDAFEPTSGQSVSGMVYVGSCPTLLVESEPHQYINQRLTLLREARTKA
jgi:hypothetical protein